MQNEFASGMTLSKAIDTVSVMHTIPSGQSSSWPGSPTAS